MGSSKGSGLVGSCGGAGSCSGTRGLSEAAFCREMTVLRNWAPFSIETASSSTWPRTAIHATQTPGLPEGLKSALATSSGMVVSSTVPVGRVEL